MNHEAGHKAQIPPRPLSSTSPDHSNFKSSAQATVQATAPWGNMWLGITARKCW